MDNPAGRNDDTRPRHLNLLQIRLPVTALVSLGHRLSGILLFLAIPLLVDMLALSVRSPEGFAKVAGLWAHPAMEVLLLVLVWAGAHHLLAGVRFLAMDLGIGETRAAGRRSAWIAAAGGVVLAVLVLAVLA